VPKGEHRDERRPALQFQPVVIARDSREIGNPQTVRRGTSKAASAGWHREAFAAGGAPAVMHNYSGAGRRWREGRETGLRGRIARGTKAVVVTIFMSGRGALTLQSGTARLAV